jgi:cell division protein FtsQ
MPTLLRDRSHGPADDTDAGAVDPRIEARRSAIAHAKRHRRRVRLLVALVLVTVAVAGYAVTRSGLLAVRSIDVQAGSHTDEDAVRAAAGVFPGQPMVDVSVDDVTHRVEALPWVETADVSRRWPRTVSIAVTERRVAAVLDDTHGGWLLLDGTGRVLGPTPPIAPEFGVHIDGLAPVDPGRNVDPKVQGALTVADRLTPNLRGRVASIHLGDQDTVQLRIRPVGTVDLGRPDDALDAKIRSLQTVLAQASLVDLCRIDLRVPDSPVLTRSAPCA